MNKSESKYFNTAVKMDEAFLELLNKKDFEFITVKEICELAKVNRSTFYLHYQTLNDLLLETSDYINRKFDSYFDPASFDFKNINNMPLKELYLITPQYLLPWLSFIKDNAKLFKTVLKQYNLLHMDNNLKFLLNEIATPALLRHNTKPQHINYTLMFYIEGIMAIVKIWLKNDCKEDINEIVTIIQNCVRGE